MIAARDPALTSFFSGTQVTPVTFGIAFQGLFLCSLSASQRHLSWIEPCYLVFLLSTVTLEWSSTLTGCGQQGQGTQFLILHEQHFLEDKTWGMGGGEGLGEGRWGTAGLQ